MTVQVNQSLSSCEQLSNMLHEEPFIYKYSTNISQTWIKKSMLINAYHHPAFKDYANRENDCNQENKIVDITILPILGILGIIGNIGGLISFSKRLSLTYYCLLFALAISDLVTIIAFILYFSLPHWIDHYTLLENSICTYIILGAYPILYIAQLLDIYLLISLSIERYYAICKPLKYRTRKFPVFYYIAPIVCFSFIYSTPLFFENSIKSVSVQKFQVKNETYEYIADTTVNVIKNSSFKVRNIEYKIIYETVLKLIVKCVVPYVCMITTNLLVVRTFYNFKSKPRMEEEEDVTTEANYERRDTNEGSSLRFHIGQRGMRLRQSQINLGFLNLAITLVFLLCYSIIWLWAIRDTWILFDTFQSKVFSYK